MSGEYKDIEVSETINAGVQSYILDLDSPELGKYAVGDRLNVFNPAHDVPGKGVVIGKNIFNNTLTVKVFWARIPRRQTDEG